MLTLLWSIEDMCACPAAWYVFHRFPYLSVPSNARIPIFSKLESSLPNVQGEVYLSVPSNALVPIFSKLEYSLPNVQGEVYFLLPCPQPVVSRLCTRPSSVVFTSPSWKMASPATGVQPILRKFGSLVNVYVKRFLFWLRLHEEFVVRAFLNVFNHVYAIFKHCYLFHRLLTPSPTLLHVRMQKSFLRPHDFRALMQRISSKVFFSPITCLQTVAFNCFHSSWKRGRYRSRVAARRYCLHSRKPCFKRFLSSPYLDFPKNTTKLPAVCCVGLGHVGGGSRRGVSWTSIKSFSKSVPDTFDVRCTLLYSVHVDEVGLKNYPPDMYVHTVIPLVSMVDVLTLANVRAIAKLHGIAVGSRCNGALLKSYIGNHSCSKCTEFVTVFSVEKSAAMKHVDRSVRSLIAAKNLTPREKKTTVSFPPEPASKDLEHAIVRDACKRMDPQNFEEVGCAVCGELKPRKNTSRLKSVKNLLKVLEAPGVTRIKRKSHNSPIREYKGPVLDYGCSAICHGCRVDVRIGKVPRLALSNNLWLGAVPNVLKNLTFVEKILVARVRHTCAFVKVASGMRKMKANIVAFESPIQKIYNILPPPREELDEVLAILFTGPAAPTEKDFARTPFLVRRNAVITALEWLRLNHADYADIEISLENAGQYGEDMPPVSVEYRPKESNKVPEGTSVFDQEEEDGTTEGDCVFTVHGLT